MGKDSKRNRRKSTTPDDNSDNYSDTETTTKKPTWGTAEPDFIPFLIALLEWLEEEDDGFRILCESGYVVSKNYLLFMSDIAIHRYRHSVTVKGSLASPIDIDAEATTLTGLGALTTMTTEQRAAYDLKGKRVEENSEVVAKNAKKALKSQHVGKAYCTETRGEEFCPQYER